MKRIPHALRTFALTALTALLLLGCASTGPDQGSDGRSPGDVAYEYYIAHEAAIVHDDTVAILSYLSARVSHSNLHTWRQWEAMFSLHFERLEDGGVISANYPTVASAEAISAARQFADRWVIQAQQDRLNPDNYARRMFSSRAVDLIFRIQTHAYDRNTSGTRPSTQRFYQSGFSQPSGEYVYVLEGRPAIINPDLQPTMRYIPAITNPDLQPTMRYK